MITQMILLFFLSSDAKADFDLRGSAAFFAGTMPSQNISDVNKNSGGVDFKAQTQYTLGRNWNLQFSPWVQQDPVNLSTEEKSQIEIQDFFLKWKKSSRIIKLGFSTENWEGTDFINPMDLLHAGNYRDPLKPQKRSSAGLFYTDQSGKISWDIAYIPKQSRTLLPGEKSPWWPRQINLPLQNDTTSLLLPDPVAYKVRDDEIIDRALDNNAGMRLQYHGEALDISLAGFEGAATPLLIPTVSGTPVVFSPTQQIFQLQSPILIDPLYYREKVGAIGFSYTHESWIFRAVAQHAQPMGSDSRLPKWSEYEVLEIEKNLSSQDLTLILQGIYAQTPDSGSLSALSTLKQKSVLLGWRWAFHENWAWQSAFFQEQKTFSVYTHQEISWNFAEHWRQEFILDLLDGSAASALGTYKNNDSVRIQTTFVF